MKGSPTVLVDPHSATQGKLLNEPEHPVFQLNHTHSEMIKFCGQDDDDYDTTLTCLRDIEERIKCKSYAWAAYSLSTDEQG